MSDSSAHRSVSDDEVILLTREAIRVAREETRRVSSEDAPKELQKPGLTIDLGHRSIAHLPEEVIDIIKDEIERLALSHNHLSHLPSRLSECNRLRYLNVRYNIMREIPPPVLQLYCLEILDMSKNRLRSLPDEIAQLTSLKVLAIQKNKIEKLPLCLGEISSLQVLKLEGNPITFPPPDICTIKKDSPSPSNENEKDAFITTQVKRYLRQISTRERLRIESEGDSSESNVETPKPPRRMMSGRFPVKPSISGFDNLETGRPESPIITRAHYRGQSQQSNGALRRPVVSPLMINSERNRSSSEGATSATIRAKRGGLVLKNVSEVDEVRTRIGDHGRDASQSSTLSGTTFDGMGGSSANSSFSSSDSTSQRTITHRPLSDLLEHKRRSRAPDVVVEAAKTIIYALVQLHGPIQDMARNTKFSDEDGDPTRAMHFHRRITDTTVLIRQLGAHLQKFDTLAEEDDEDATNLSDLIRNDLIASTHTFMMLLVSIYDSVKEISRDNDPRVVRTVLLLLQGSTSEIRNACSMLGVNFQAPEPEQAPVDVTAFAAPYTGRTITTNSSSASVPHQRIRPNGTPYQPSNSANSVNLVPELSVSSADHSRSSTASSISAVTPRSGESFATLSSRVGPYPTEQELEDEARFEKIFLKLRTATERITKVLPAYRQYFHKQRLALESQMDPSIPRAKYLADLVYKTDEVLLCTDVLGRRLSDIKLRDASARNQQGLWQKSTTFCKLWSEFATLIMQAAPAGVLPPDLRRTLKPIHKAIKDSSVEINASPWSHLALPHATNQLIPPPPTITSGNYGTTTNFSSPAPSTYATLSSRPATSFSTAASLPPPNPNPPPTAPLPNPINTSIASAAALAAREQSSALRADGLVTPVPATPLSAALGAAAQATVPNGSGHSHAPSTTSQNSVASSSIHTSAATSGIPTMPMQAGFPGTSVVFERADRLLNSTQRRV